MSKLSILIAALCAFTVSTYAGNSEDGLMPNGTHYNLNLIGVPKQKAADMTGNNGHRIFVALGSKVGSVATKILLSPGEDFLVTDANGTDGTAAFELPVKFDDQCDIVVDPTTGDIDVQCPVVVTVNYTVWARALGKPGGSALMYTCAEGPDYANDPTQTVEYCSDPEWQLNLSRTAGPSKFTNVSKELFFVSADIDGDKIVEHVPLFDEVLHDYFWMYDNAGLKLVQLRFYEGDYTIVW